MNSAIVIYNSRSGNTKMVAEKIAQGLETHSVNQSHIPELSPYSLIVIGSWAVMGRISFKGARMLRKIRRKLEKTDLETKKIALFFTAGGPDEINPMMEKKGISKTIRETMFETMQERLQKCEPVNIVPERYYCQGAIRVPRWADPSSGKGHPTPEELDQAVQFGVSLRKYYD